MLIEAKANVNHASGYDGWTGLHVACSGGNLDLLRLLIENKADLDRKSNVGDTGLVLAAREGHFECVNMMMEAKADVACKNYDDDTALTTAFRANHFNILMLLLDRSWSYAYGS